MPDLTAPGAVKKAEVEMVAAVALKNTTKCGVFRNIKVFSKMYVDYAYYKDSFGGTLAAEELNRYAAQEAERSSDHAPMGEISEVAEQVKNAVCAAAEAVAEIREGVANIPQGIKSESTDGYSVTYNNDYNADELAEREKRAMYKVIKQELSGTGLLYQGVR